MSERTLIGVYILAGIGSTFLLAIITAHIGKFVTTVKDLTRRVSAIEREIRPGNGRE